jgi:lipid-A-disaccharide synthase-like uncharacterized protein
MAYILAANVVLFSFIHATLPDTMGGWIWLMVGISGSAVFGGRFFLQWMHSEKHKESRIPISFWWLSVIGTLMTAAYTVHQREWVLLLGNGPQLVPYSRNLVLIYRKKRLDAEAAA